MDNLMDDLINANSLAETKKRALRILGNLSFSEKGMAQRLMQKGESAENAEETARWLVELGYINDSDYASSIVRHYSLKGYGEKRVRDELHKRGIPRDMWEEKLAELDGEELGDAAIEFLRKKLRGSVDDNDLRRATDALVRRGFSYSDARSAINAYLEENGE
ncbi:MAG: recombination regulator RecX [Oscillospiraceae bacterium]|nr:recombination regulator RecX [Oscillospiraceae bacterium]